MRITGPTGGALGTVYQQIAGACDVAEDPELDARQVWPLWNRADDSAVQVCGDRTDGVASSAFSVWRVPGRKHMAHRGSRLCLGSSCGPVHMLATMPLAMEDGTPYRLSVPLDSHLRARLGGYQQDALLLQGLRPRAAARAPTRSALLHLRALQALDGVAAGASQREIAEVLFGIESTRERWTDDGELRAQVRHLISRAEGFVRHGYLALAGVGLGHDGAHGDERQH